MIEDATTAHSPLPAVSYVIVVSLTEARSPVSGHSPGSVLVILSKYDLGLLVLLESNRLTVTVSYTHLTLPTTGVV